MITTTPSLPVTIRDLNALVNIVAPVSIMLPYSKSLHPRSASFVLRR